MGRQLSSAAAPGAALASKLDIDRIVFDGDRDLRRELLADKRFVRLLIARDADAASVSARRQLLLSALRLSPAMAPEPLAALSHVSETLGIEADVELYCVSETRINAFVVPPRDAGGVLLVGLTSEALERLDEGELRFVLGHEIGHALLGHFNLSVADLVGHDDVAPIQLVRLAAWMRYAELSADRVGLLCSDDFDAAVRAFFKLTSGLSKPSYLGHARAHADQLAAVTRDQMESSEADWFATHPYSPIRVKALDLFARSETFHALAGRSASEARFHRFLGKSGALLPEQELEREVSGLMSLMNPSFMSDDLDVVVWTRELCALAGMAVALADGRITRGERKALGKLVGRRGMVDKAEALLELSPAEHDARLRQVAERLKSHLSPLACRKVIEDLLAVALADRRLDRAEVETVIEVAGLIGMPAEEVERSLVRLLKHLD